MMRSLLRLLLSAVYTSGTLAGALVGQLVGGRTVVGARRLAASRAAFGMRCAVGSPLPLTSGAESCIYLDYAATCPIYPDVAEAMVPYFTTQWGNPSSPHSYGRQTKVAVDTARAHVGTLLGCNPSEVIFTSCGSESDNWAILGAVELGRAFLQPGDLPHVVTTTIEHPAITACLDHMEQRGEISVSSVGVDSWGRVTPADVANAVCSRTVLVSVMHANNEVGTVQPIAAIVQAVRAANPKTLLHTDAAQTVGKVPVSVSVLGVDLLTLVGHKIGAPKGVAALYVREGLVLPKMLFGGGQESGRRAGTECVPLIVGLGEACAIWNEQGVEIAQHSASIRDRLLANLESKLGAGRLRIVSPISFGPSLAGEWPALPNVLSVCVRGAKSAQILARLQEDVAASAGAACHSHAADSVSGVLGELKVPIEYAQGALRLSVGRHTTMAEVDRGAELIAEAVLACDRLLERV
mmetsp:Transcript_40214/g.99384  ORF Transcript_40214/g.99384 Transcript_40214/m.99384 type:complete len:466 (-) Transcript_40214:79-1476(-)|eukprot:CAMPEP_0179855426 /NCGR_PEP_ID=MMETSP0982-20121206/10520_1 /TAXON_ID=483367 /ORGANISM="non described non described, Strain CCMP 2436" /LENGTH=465 /DNA_ID=CAMNT_0021741497 /DNA_START=141 /DNA_END=1538 /DNA_ORIENTATION=+